MIDPAREGVDCVLRVGIPADSDLIGRQLGSPVEVTVASPAYLVRFKTPRSLDDLAGHRMIGFVSSQTGQSMPLCFTVAGVEVRRMVPDALATTGAETMVSAARHGVGLVQAPHYHLAEDLCRGTLVEVLSDARPAPLPVTLLYPMQRQLSPRVRVFLDWVRKINFGA